MCEAPFGPSRQRYLTPFFPNALSEDKRCILAYALGWQFEIATGD